MSALSVHPGYVGSLSRVNRDLGNIVSVTTLIIQETIPMYVAINNLPVEICECD
jgi:hypothetical protein